MREYLDSHFVVYGADITQAYGWRLARRLEAESFPFVLVRHQTATGSFATADRVPGCTDGPDAFVARLMQAVENASAQDGHDEQAQTGAAAAGRMPAFNLRAAQQAAYQRALEADQARERAEQEAREKKEAAERALQEKNAVLFNKRLALHKRLAESAAPPSAGEAVSVAVRLPSGQRVVRRFCRDDSLALVFAWADEALYGPFPPAGVTERTYKSATAETTGAVLPFSLVVPLKGVTYDLERSADAPVQTLGNNALLQVRTNTDTSAQAEDDQDTEDDDEDGEDDEDEDEETDDDDDDDDDEDDDDEDAE